MSTNKNIVWHKMGDFLMTPNQPMQLPILIPQSILNGNNKMPVKSLISLNKERKEFMELVLKSLDEIQKENYQNAVATLLKIMDKASISHPDELNMNAFSYNGFRILYCYSCLKSKDAAKAPEEFITEFNIIHNYKFVRYLDIMNNFQNENYAKTIHCIDCLKNESDTATMLHIQYNSIDLFDEEFIPEINVGILNKNIEIIGLYCLLCLKENETGMAISNEPIAFLQELLNVLSEGLQRKTREIMSKYDNIKTLKNMFDLPQNKKLFTNIIYSGNIYEKILKFVNDNSLLNNYVAKDNKIERIVESKSTKKKKRKNVGKVSCLENSPTKESKGCHSCTKNEENKDETDDVNLNKKECEKLHPKTDVQILNVDSAAENLNSLKTNHKEDDNIKNENLNSDYVKELNSSMKKNFEELLLVFNNTKRDVTNNVNEKIKTNEELLNFVIEELKHLKTTMDKALEDKNAIITRLNEQNSRLQEDFRLQLEINNLNSKSIMEFAQMNKSLQSNLREVDQSLMNERSKNSQLLAESNKYLEEKSNFLDKYYKNLIDNEIIAIDFLNEFTNCLASNQIENNIVNMELSNKKGSLMKLINARKSIVKDGIKNIPLKFPLLCEDETKCGLSFITNIKQLLINNINNINVTGANDTEGASSLVFLNDDLTNKVSAEDLSKEKGIHEYLTRHLKYSTTDEIADALIKLSQNNAIFDMSNEEILSEVRNLLEIDRCCTICLDDLNKLRTTRLQCNHIFHKKCIGSWFRGNPSKICPICRVPDEFPAL